MTSPLEIIGTIVSVGKFICQSVAEVKGFKSRKKTLVRRIEVIVQPVEALQREARARPESLPTAKEVHVLEQQQRSSGDTGGDGALAYIRPLKDLAECIKQVETFMQELAKMCFSEKFLSKNKITGKFDSFNNQLTTLQQSLTVSLQVKLGIVFSKDMKHQLDETFNQYNMLQQNMSDLKEDLEEMMENIRETTHDTNDMVKALQDQIHDLQQRLTVSREEYEDLRINYDELTKGVVISEGTYGPIYKARHKTEDTILVVKEYDDSAQFAREELLDQLNLWKKLRFSKFIVQLHGYSTDDKGRMCFVVEFMSNGTLRDVLQNKEDHDLPWDEKHKQRLTMARDCAQGLYAIHYGQIKPMLHRAVTSTRFLVDQYYRVKISDNGFVKSQSKISKSKCAHSGNLEQDEMNYLTPEETGSNFRRSVKTEIYKFGVILYEIASRKRPFESVKSEKGGSLNDLEKHNYIKAGKMEEPPQGTPEMLVDLMNRCRKTNPEDRPSTIEVVTTLNDMC